MLLNCHGIYATPNARVFALVLDCFDSIRSACYPPLAQIMKQGIKEHSLMMIPTTVADSSLPMILNYEHTL